jgi:hypothetical protein
MTNIDTYIHEIEKQIPIHIYLLLCEIEYDINKKYLLIIDEKLTQFMIKLDEDTTINKQERKQKIMKIQQIQKSIDKVMDKNINTKKTSLETYKLKKISDFIHQQNYKINELKLANAELQMQMGKFKKDICLTQQ